MGRIVLVFIVVCLNYFVLTTERESGNVQYFIDHEIVPDVLMSLPDELLMVTFPSGVKVLAGNELTPSEVAGEPNLVWSADPKHFYSLIFCDADAPSRVDPNARSFLHWLVVNIPGDDVTAGETLTSLLNSHPEPETGLHRYIFLVYQQPGLIEFDEQPNDSFERRINFSPEDFSIKYNLGNPIAGNFYQTENLDD